VSTAEARTRWNPADDLRSPSDLPIASGDKDHPLRRCGHGASKPCQAIPIQEAVAQGAEHRQKVAQHVSAGFRPPMNTQPRRGGQIPRTLDLTTSASLSNARQCREHEAEKPPSSNPRQDDTPSRLPWHAPATPFQTCRQNASRRCDSPTLAEVKGGGARCRVPALPTPTALRPRAQGWPRNEAYPGFDPNAVPNRIAVVATTQSNSKRPAPAPRPNGAYQGSQGQRPGSPSPTPTRALKGRPTPHTTSILSRPRRGPTTKSTNDTKSNNTRSRPLPPFASSRLRVRLTGFNHRRNGRPQESQGDAKEPTRSRSGPPLRLRVSARDKSLSA
jgi:hypothetical protein